MKAAKCFFIVFIMLIALFLNGNAHALQTEFDETEHLTGFDASEMYSRHSQALPYTPSTSKPLEKHEITYGKNRFETHIVDTRPVRRPWSLPLPKDVKGYVFLGVLLAAIIALVVFLKRRDMRLYEEEINENPGGSRLLQFAAILCLLLFFWATMSTMKLFEELADLGVGRQIGVSLFIRELKEALALNPGLMTMGILLLIGYIATLIMGVMGLVRWNLTSRYLSLHLLSMLFLGIIVVYNGFLIYYHDFFENFLNTMLVLVPTVLYILGVMANKNHYDHYLRIEAQKRRRNPASAAAIYGDSSYGQPFGQSQSAAATYGVSERFVPQYVPNQYVSKEQDVDIYTNQEDYIRSNMVSMKALQAQEQMHSSQFERHQSPFGSDMYADSDAFPSSQPQTQREIPTDRVISNDSTILNDNLIERDPTVFIPNQLDGFGYEGLGDGDVKVEHGHNDQMHYDEFRPSSSLEDIIAKNRSNDTNR